MKATLSYAPAVPEVPALPCLLLHIPTGCIVLVTHHNSAASIYSGFKIAGIGGRDNGIGSPWTCCKPENYVPYTGTVSLEN